MAACGSGETVDSSATDTAVLTDSETAWDKIEEAGVLKAATSGTLYPNSYHDKETDELTGYEVEILREIAERIGVEVEFTEMGVDGMLTSVNSGAVDVAAFGMRPQWRKCR